MLVEAVKRLLGLKKKTGIKLIVSCEKLEKRVALLENNRLEEYTIERETDRNIVGSIYKGKVRNIEPGIKAMFVDIGFEKNAFLQFWDAIPAALDSGIETINREGGNKKKAPRITHKDVPNIYPVGSDVLVQVKKGPISNKGPRITTDISLAGRYLVLMPFNDQFGISRKIEDPKERDRLRTILRELDVPEGMGIIMRTVGAGQRARYFVRDLSLLLEQWAQVQSGMEQKQAPACLFEEPDLVERTVRDFLTDEVDAIIVDDAKSVERMQEIVGHISKRAKKSIQHYTGAQPIFECFGVKAQIEAAFHRQVWLPCGGYIVIDETEAMIAVDVNTGRNKGAKDMEKTILQTNLEAAEEIARQLRLRNIGGLSDVSTILKSQAENDENQIASSYTLIGGMVWAIPVLGFIGTVQGLSAAIGTFTQTLAASNDIGAIKSNLQGVTSGLSTAFETTLVALVMALFLQLYVSALQKRETDFLDECNDYCHQHVIAKLKLVTRPPESPLS